MVGAVAIMKRTCTGCFTCAKELLWTWSWVMLYAISVLPTVSALCTTVCIRWSVHSAALDGVLILFPGIADFHAVRGCRICDPSVTKKEATQPDAMAAVLPRES